MRSRTSGRRLTATVEPLPPRQLPPLRRLDGVDHRRGNGQRADHVVVEDANASGGDGAHGQLLVTGHAELAHQKGVERRAKGLGDFGGNRHPATRQTQDDHIWLVGVRDELGGELTASIAPVTKRQRHGSFAFVSA